MIGKSEQPVAPQAAQSPELSRIAENLAGIRRRIDTAAKRAGRNPDEITLVAVSKTQSVALLAAAVAAGQRVFGENRVQEALPKLLAMGPAIDWHFIGHLQRNKVNSVVGRFSLIHSVDSARLIDAINVRAAALGITQRILLELNLAGEASKTGASPADLPALLDALAAAPNVACEGLMTVPPHDVDPESSRPYFSGLRELAATLPGLPNLFPTHLSMGMSGDFEVAIEEGATLVRIGSMLFGPRPTPHAPA